MRFESWGRYPGVKQTVVPYSWRFDRLPAIPDHTILPFGRGRSYGDVCLNDQQFVLSTQGLDRFIAFDDSIGLLRCESGTTVEQILKTIVPRGWILPVLPGTKFVTIGGAIANDIHGKNHHRAGTFGRHVTQFELLRSDGRRMICSRDENPELFAASIGGLGLTGMITWAEIRLKRIPGPFIDEECIPFSGLEEFLAVSQESNERCEYNVAWIDCLAKGSKLARGFMLRGNHTEQVPAKNINPPRKLTVPFDAPALALNPYSVALFNRAIHFGHRRNRRRLIHYEPFFFPLDAIHHWNRIYGRRGFFQHQCVVPLTDTGKAIREILQTAVAARMGSFLVVFKTFGALHSPGWLSFPREGVTLALDFPNTGQPALELMRRLDEIVGNAGGAIYPAKDARMSKETFRAGFPEWERFERQRDPGFSSSFWRRVTE